MLFVGRGPGAHGRRRVRAHGSARARWRRVGAAAERARPPGLAGAATRRGVGAGAGGIGGPITAACVRLRARARLKHTGGGCDGICILLPKPYTLNPKEEVMAFACCMVKEFRV